MNLKRREKNVKSPNHKMRATFLGPVYQEPGEGFSPRIGRRCIGRHVSPLSGVNAYTESGADNH